MNIEIAEESFASLAEHVSILIAFEITSFYEVVEQEGDLGGFALSERPVDASYIKDYDAIESPMDWPNRFDLSSWGLIAAHADGRRVGGAIVAFNTPDVDMLERRHDLAVLWDLRVSPKIRRNSIGHALFQAVERWAVERGCQQLKVETQNVNVPACEFYARQGCTLDSVDRFAYAELPDEVQLIWRKNVSSHA